MNIWTIHSFAEEAQKCFRVGPLRFWLRRANSGWEAHQEREGNLDEQLAVDHGEFQKLSRYPQVDEKDWERWAAIREGKALRLSPCLSALPVIFKPTTPTKLVNGASCKITVALPVCICVKDASRETTLAEVASVALSKTWFGDPTSGEPGLSMRTEIVRFNQILPTHMAACTLELENASGSEELFLDRICIRTEHLALYANGNHLHTGDVKLVYKGPAQIADVSYPKTPPTPNAQEIAPARVAPNAVNLRRSFSSFHSRLYG